MVCKKGGKRGRLDEPRLCATGQGETSVGHTTLLERWLLVLLPLQRGRWRSEFSWTREEQVCQSGPGTIRRADPSAGLTGQLRLLVPLLLQHRDSVPNRVAGPVEQVVDVFGYLTVEMAPPQLVIFLFGPWLQFLLLALDLLCRRRGRRVIERSVERLGGALRR